MRFAKQEVEICSLNAVRLAAGMLFRYGIDLPSLNSLVRLQETLSLERDSQFAENVLTAKKRVLDEIEELLQL